MVEYLGGLGMSNNDTGGPAFPVEVGINNRGMFLRDYFAAKAMQGLLSADVRLQLNHVTIAHMAYEQADAMLETRK